MTNIIDYLEYTSVVHDQNCLQIIDNKSNFESIFLPNVNLSSTSLYVIMYCEVILNITSESTHLWKIIQKQALSKQKDAVETKTNNLNVNTLIQAFIKSISTIKALSRIFFLPFIVPNNATTGFIYSRSIN